MLSLLPHEGAHRIACDVAAGTRALRWDSLLRRTKGPRDVDALPHCEALHEFRSELTLCIAHPRAALPLPPGETTCLWYLQENQVPTALPEDDAVCLAGSPRVAARLRERFPARTVHECFVAAPDDAPDIDPSAFRDANTVLVVGDLPDIGAKKYRIEESSHQRLWRQLNERAHDAWQTAAAGAPDKLLAQAVRDSGVVLRDPQIRESFVQLVREVCLPAAGWEDIVKVIRQTGFRIEAIGLGWARLCDDRLRVVGADLLTIPDEQWPNHPAACVIAGNQDPLSPVTLQGALRGWPLVIYDAGRQTLCAALGDVFASEKHVTPFADTVELRAALQCIQTAPDEVQARVVDARDHVRREHTFARRLQELVARLS